MKKPFFEFEVGRPYRKVDHVNSIGGFPGNGDEVDVELMYLCTAAQKNLIRRVHSGNSFPWRMSFNAKRKKIVTYSGTGRLIRYALVPRVDGLICLNLTMQICGDG